MKNPKSIQPKMKYTSQLIGITLILSGIFGVIAGYREEEKRYRLEAAYRESISADDDYFRTLKKRPDPTEYFGKVAPEYLAYKNEIGNLIDTLRTRLRETKAQVSSLEQDELTKRKWTLWSGATVAILAGIFSMTGRGFSRRLKA